MGIEKFTDCNRPYARPLLECFFRSGVLVSIKSLTERTDLEKVLSPKNSRVGVVLLIDDVDLENSDNILQRVRSVEIATFFYWRGLTVVKYYR